MVAPSQALGKALGTGKTAGPLPIADLREGPELDVMGPIDFKRIQAEQARRTRAKIPVKQLSRRSVYQTYQAAQKMLDGLWSFRDRARRARQYDRVADLTSAIFHLKRSLAYLAHFSRREFGRDPEDLAGYK